MKRYERGSEWRKWDLHVHAPGTKLNDGYGEAAWGAFLDEIESSDVAVVGIADYFSLDTFFEAKSRHKEKYPDSEKVLLPNLELRLNESVNRNNEMVHLHLVFRPDIEKAKVDELLSTLKTTQRDGQGRFPACSELSTRAELESATVSRESIASALESVFGHESHVRDQVIWFVPANNDGIRAGQGQRQAALADEIEKDCQALFGHPGNTEYFLNPARYEGDVVAPGKPVFAGSDAHSLDELQHWLGKTVAGDISKHVTWVKADPTFEGLQQTLIEPSDRVRISPTQPDTKQPYKVIAKVVFHDSSMMPDSIELNPNLVSVIGSRSSGKSALLAYIANAVDSEYTRAQQRQAQPHIAEQELGPAAGVAWNSDDAVECTIEWVDGEHEGKIIYVPQNSLFALSSRPKEITEQVEPALHHLDPDFEIAHTKANASIAAAGVTVREQTERWFALGSTIREQEKALADLGDPVAIQAQRDELSDKVAALREESSLTEAETATYQGVVDRLGKIENRRQEIDSAAIRLAPFLVRDEDEQGVITYRPSDALRVDLRLHPDATALPPELEATVSAFMNEAKSAAEDAIAKQLAAYQGELDNEREDLAEQENQLKADHAELIEKNKANSEIESNVRDVQLQDELLEQVGKATEALDQLRAQRKALVEDIASALEARAAALRELRTAFDANARILEQMQFGLEIEFDTETRRRVSDQLNKLEVGPYVTAHRTADIEKAHGDPATFLNAIETGAQKVLQHTTAQQVAIDMLMATEEIRFFAELEGDRIGGFKPSSMTPGKQAFFALSLILSQDQDNWPLLIDQPEDDLDSRSVYKVLVDYLKGRKSERQIIMASHNANLVVGADSEQVLVANRHGSDRKNDGDRFFDYLGGSLEHSQERRSHEHILRTCGIREHACDVLDGGEEAFLKRHQKYRLAHG